LGRYSSRSTNAAAASGGVCGENTDLAVLGAAGRAGVLALNPGRGDPLLDEARVIDDEHPAVVVAEVLGDIGLEVVTHFVRVPVRPVQQPLEAIGSAMAGELGQLPAVLAANGREQAPHIVSHPTTKVSSAEPVADAKKQVVKFSFPTDVRMLIDHTGKLSASEPSHFPDPLVGGVLGQDPTRHPPATYTPETTASDQAR
jgi:hypothetical protein